MNIGDRVRIVFGCDETFDHSFLGKAGTVVDLSHGKAGVGESPLDPFLLVEFDDAKREGFWTEEIQIIA
jgi:hypothetical protein